MLQPGRGNEGGKNIDRWQLSPVAAEEHSVGMRTSSESPGKGQASKDLRLGKVLSWETRGSPHRSCL